MRTYRDVFRCCYSNTNSFRKCLSLALLSLPHNLNLLHPRPPLPGQQNITKWLRRGLSRNSHRFTLAVGSVCTCCAFGRVEAHSAVVRRSKLNHSPNCTIICFRRVTDALLRKDESLSHASISCRRVTARDKIEDITSTSFQGTNKCD